MRTNERGVALITVIMVLLVLTVLGIAASMMMTQEDRTTSRQELQKMALYAAEAGLRQGEQVLRGYSLGMASTLLAHPPTALTSVLPEPKPTPPTYVPPNWDTHHLGTYLIDNTNKELANQEVALTVVTGSVATGKRAFYSLYVRNNPQDVGQNALVDNDGRVRLVAVAWITNVDGTDSLWTKILEEEYLWAGTGSPVSAQKGVNAGSTGQAQM